jgi:hypothetical protein
VDIDIDISSVAFRPLATPLPSVFFMVLLAVPKHRYETVPTFRYEWYPKNVTAVPSGRYCQKKDESI